jgi:hypothetical protein
MFSIYIYIYIYIYGYVLQIVLAVVTGPTEELAGYVLSKRGKPPMFFFFFFVIIAQLVPKYVIITNHSIWFKKFIEGPYDLNYNYKSISGVKFL